MDHSPHGGRRATAGGIRSHGMRRLGVVLLTLAAALVAAPAGAAHADTGWHEINSLWANKCIDMIRESGTGNGVLAQLWDCTQTPEQQFAVIDAGGGFFLLQNQRSGRCLRPSEDQLTTNTLIEQFDCSFADFGQQWQSVDPGGNSQGARWLINRLSNKCIEDSAWATVNGVKLTQSDCLGAWKDFWYVV